MLSPRLVLGLSWGAGQRPLWVPDPPCQGWHPLGLILHPPAQRDGAALCVCLGRCWALNENMAYWWIIRIPILLASLVGGHPPAPRRFGKQQLSLGWGGRWGGAAPCTAQEGGTGLQSIRLRARGVVFC